LVLDIWFEILGLQVLRFGWWVSDWKHVGTRSHDWLVVFRLHFDVGSRSHDWLVGFRLHFDVGTRSRDWLVGFRLHFDVGTRSRDW